MERPEVFYTYEWAVAVQRAYGDVRKPLLFLSYEGESLVGLVAFATEKNGSRDLSFLTASTADYCDFLSDPGRRREFVEAVFCELQTRKIDKVVLTNLPADSCSVAAISSAAPKCGYNLHSRSAYLCARVVLGSREDRAELKKGIAGKKKLRRNLRELEKKGRICIRHDTQWEQIEPILESFNRAHVARFLSTGRISNLIRSERRKFLYELVRELSCSEWAAVSRLLVGEIPVAWNYGFRFAGSWFWYQPTVESSHEYADFSPGYCLLSKIVELACDYPDIDVVDLGLGAEEYKDRFATASRETLYCVLNRSFSNHIQMVVREGAVAVAKASPTVEGRLRLMISYVARFRARARNAGGLGLLMGAFRQVRSFLFASDEVLFFEGTAENQFRLQRSTTLLPLDSELLGAAAIRYADDPATLGYLMRSAERFRCEQDHGFALITAEGTPVHFCWVRDFEGFKIPELDRSLRAPAEDAVIIFDCFTAPSARSGGLFGEAIGLLADQLRAQGKVPWIFGDAADQVTLLAIEKSGFTYRFSLGRTRIFFFNRTRDSIPSLGAKNLARSAPEL